MHGDEEKALSKNCNSVHLSDVGKELISGNFLARHVFVCACVCACVNLGPSHSMNADCELQPFVP